MVTARKNESLESLIRRFNRSVEAAGIMRELKKRRHAQSPSQKKRDKRKRARKLAQKQASSN